MGTCKCQDMDTCQNKQNHGYMFVQNVNLQKHGYMLRYSHQQNTEQNAKGENDVAQAYRRHQHNTG